MRKRQRKKNNKKRLKMHINIQVLLPYAVCGISEEIEKKILKINKKRIKKIFKHLVKIKGFWMNGV